MESERGWGALVANKHERSKDVQGALRQSAAVSIFEALRQVANGRLPKCAHILCASGLFHFLSFFFPPILAKFDREINQLLWMLRRRPRALSRSLLSRCVFAA